MRQELAWWCGLIAVMLGAACWITRPLVFGMWEHAYDLSDALYTAWALDHNYHVFSKMDWGNYWKAPMFTPYEYSLVLADAHLGTAVWTYPFYLVTGSAVFAQNCAILGSFVGTGVACYLLAGHVTSRRWLALLLGLAGMAAPFRVAQLVHIQVLATQWFLLSIWCLLQCAVRPRAVYVVGTCLFSLLTLTSSLYFGMFQALLLVPVGVVLAVRGKWYRRDQLLKPWLWTFLLISPLVVWFLLPYYLVYQTEGFERRISVTMWGSAQPSYFMNLSREHVLTNHAVFGNGDHEFALFPGWVFLSALGMSAFVFVREHNVWAKANEAAGRIWTWTRTHREWSLGATCAAIVLYWWLFHAPIGPPYLNLRHDFMSVPWATISRTMLFVISFAAVLAVLPAAWSRGWVQTRGVVFWCWIGIVVYGLLSFGPLIHQGHTAVAIGPYAVLYRLVPGFRGMRVPARLVLLILPLMVLVAGKFYDREMDRLRGGRWARVVPISLVILLMLDFAVRPAPWQHAPLRRDLPRSVVWLSENGEPGGVLVLPVDTIKRQPSPMYLYYGLFHRRPMLNGYPAFTPSEINAMTNHLLRFPEATAIEVTRSRGVRYVVIDLIEMGFFLGSQSVDSFVALCDESTELTKISVACDEQFLVYEILPRSTP